MADSNKAASSEHREQKERRKEKRSMEILVWERKKEIICQKSNSMQVVQYSATTIAKKEGGNWGWRWRREAGKLRALGLARQDSSCWLT